MSIRHGLSDEDWDLFEPLFLKACGPKGRKPLDNRRFVHALFWIGATGAPWRDLPAEFGHFRGVHKRFAGLCRRGVFERLFALARDSGRPDLSLCSIDSTSAKAWPKAAGARRRMKEKQSAEGSKKRGFGAVRRRLVDRGSPGRRRLLARRPSEETRPTTRRRF